MKQNEIIMTTQQQNVSLFNQQINNSMTREQVLEFCSRARIKVYNECVDSDVQDSFIEYYGFLPQWSANNDCFIMTFMNRPEIN